MTLSIADYIASVTDKTVYRAFAEALGEGSAAMTHSPPNLPHEIAWH